LRKGIAFSFPLAIRLQTKVTTIHHQKDLLGRLPSSGPGTPNLAFEFDCTGLMNSWLSRTCSLVRRTIELNGKMTNTVKYIDPFELPLAKERSIYRSIVERRAGYIKK
jgi:hypothetical protein